MIRKAISFWAASAVFSLLSVDTLRADPFAFSTGSPDGLMASATRPDSAGVFEIETADDFVLTGETKISSGTFIGLLPTGVALSDVSAVTVEIYRVFPLDSTVPASGNVPTRVNSPSDVAFDLRDSGAATLSYTVTLLGGSFTAANSVQPGGIHAMPNQTTGGNGPVTGQEIEIAVTLTTPFDLAADHYFFVPQVELSTGAFLWLSAPKPIVAPGTPFSPDLQAWARDEGLDPDWLRAGTDIVGPPPGGGTAPTFNMTFTLVGDTVPEPRSWLLMMIAFAGAAFARRRAVLVGAAR